MTRVLVVDDHALFRAGVRAELEGRVELVGDAATVDDAVAAIAELRPDVVLLDVHMPDGGGVEVLRRAAEMEAARARGSPATAGAGHGAQLPGSAPPRFLALSVSDAAEDVIAVIRAGARGYLYKEIALRLGISVKTVEAHVSAVLRKLQLSTRHQLSRWAAERRLLE